MGGGGGGGVIAALTAVALCINGLLMGYFSQTSQQCFIVLFTQCFALWPLVSCRQKHIRNDLMFPSQA